MSCLDIVQKCSISWLILKSLLVHLLTGQSLCRQHCRKASQKLWMLTLCHSLIKIPNVKFFTVTFLWKNDVYIFFYFSSSRAILSVYYSVKRAVKRVCVCVQCYWFPVVSPLQHLWIIRLPGLLYMYFMRDPIFQSHLPPPWRKQSVDQISCISELRCFVNQNLL